MGKKSIKAPVGARFLSLTLTRNLGPYSKYFNTYHPHFHILLVVKGSYFSKNYITKTEWREMWQQSLGLNYKPNIDIKVVNDNQNKKLLQLMVLKKIIF